MWSSALLGLFCSSPILCAGTVSFTNEVHGIAWATVKEVEPVSRKIHILRWDPNVAQLRLCVPSKGPVTVSNVVEQTQALAGFNGSYFEIESGTPTVYLRTERKTWQGEGWDERDGGALVWGANRTVRIKAKPSGGWGAASGSPILSSWPILVKNGQPTSFPSTPSYRERHPRTAVARDRAGYWYAVVVDGRSEFARGMQVTELAAWLVRNLKVDFALGLDGGGSSTLVVRGPERLRVINHPANPGGHQRPVGNTLVLLPVVPHRE
jgi:exopolysaccharide biosynthesis protein